MTFTPLSFINNHPGVNDGITLLVKRDDLVHPVIQGNKWRKLNLLANRIKNEKIPGVLTFGGPFSNHVHATALAGKLLGFKTAAILRGMAADFSNPTLRDAVEQGMELFAIPKREYDLKEQSESVRAVMAQFPGYFILPEGVATVDGVLGAAGISKELTQEQLPGQRLVVAVPAGTGSTAAGVIGGMEGQGEVLVFPAAAYGVSPATVRQMLQNSGFPDYQNFQFITDYLMGHFAQPDPEIITFAKDFEQENGFALDPFYTSRMMYGLFDLLKRNHFPPETVIVAVHTGGLQAWRGLESCQKGILK